MSVHLEIAIHRLKKSLVGLAATVEEQVRKAVTAFNERDEKLAREVAGSDEMVDQLELDIEEECLRTLALYQPVALDLRFVIAVLKINNDLERIGDLAVNIAERAVSICEQRSLKEGLDYHEMEVKTMDMLKGCIDSFISSDPDRAREVCVSDVQMDRMHQQNYRRVEELVVKSPNDAALIIQHLSLSRYLERIADLTTNIAEDVIYLVEGRIVRHTDVRK